MRIPQPVTVGQQPVPRAAFDPIRRADIIPLPQSTGNPMPRMLGAWVGEGEKAVLAVAYSLGILERALGPFPAA